MDFGYIVIYYEPKAIIRQYLYIQYAHSASAALPTKSPDKSYQGDTDEATSASVNYWCDYIELLHFWQLMVGGGRKSQAKF